MSVHDLHYQIPGALVLLNGVYSTDGNLFEFKGHVRTQATASQMVTGWKSWLLKPVDPFLKKNGAGLELPISISGTKGDVQFGLALHGTADESNQAMAADLKSNRQQMLNDAKARRELEKQLDEEKQAGEITEKDAKKAERKAAKERRKTERREQTAPTESGRKPSAEGLGQAQQKPQQTVQAAGQKPSPDEPKVDKHAATAPQ